MTHVLVEDQSLTAVSPARQQWRAWWALGVVLVALVSAWIGFRTADGRSPVTWRVGSVYSMPDMASAEADGIAYRIPLDVPWRGADGVNHEGGRPECVAPIGPIARVRFAEVHVGIEGAPVGVVVFVDCRP
jgi:hypothetical protein